MCLEVEYDCGVCREQPIDYGKLQTSLESTCIKMGLKDMAGTFKTYAIPIIS